MKPIKCSRCGSTKDIKFYSKAIYIIPHVIAIPICLKCSKALVAQSSSHWQNIAFFNKIRYRGQIVFTAFFSLLFIAFAILGFIYYNPEPNCSSVYSSETGYVPCDNTSQLQDGRILLSIFGIIGFAGFSVSMNTIRKYGF